MPVIVESTLTLRRKLAAIRRDIHNIEKRGRNTFHQYDYAQASDVAGQIGTALAEHNIVVARRNLEVTRSLGGRDGKDTIVELKLEYGFLDADSNEELWQPAYGEGRDTSDKAAYKAFTGAFKYLLIQAFCLATGDDPETDDEKEQLRPDRRSANNKTIIVTNDSGEGERETEGARAQWAVAEADGKPSVVVDWEGVPPGASADDDPTLTEAQAKIIADLIKVAHPHNAMNVIRQRWNKNFQSMRQIRRSQVREFCRTVGIEEPQ